MKPWALLPINVLSCCKQTKKYKSYNIAYDCTNLCFHNNAFRDGEGKNIERKRVSVTMFPSLPKALGYKNVLHQLTYKCWYFDLKNGKGTDRVNSPELPSSFAGSLLSMKRLKG